MEVGVVDNYLDKINEKSISKESLIKLLDLIESVKFGSVTLIIQDGKVIQLEKNEKVRLK
ncbi:YezD family protein [Serpentinicella alkaliphila]|nr:YezD family protein [Serpentinicella alkaliphila]